MENKTASEMNKDEIDELSYVHYPKYNDKNKFLLKNIQRRGGFRKGYFLAQQQLKAKQKEIEQCKELANIQYKRWIERHESQQKEIEGLREDLKRTGDLWTQNVTELQTEIDNQSIQIESQSARIKNLEEGIREISRNSFSQDFVRSHAQSLLTPHTEAKEEEVTLKDICKPYLFKICPTCTDSVKCSVIKICQHPLGNS